MDYPAKDYIATKFLGRKGILKKLLYAGLCDHSPDFDMPSNSARMVLVAAEHDEVRAGQFTELVSVGQTTLKALMSLEIRL